MAFQGIRKTLFSKEGEPLKEVNTVETEYYQKWLAESTENCKLAGENAKLKAELESQRRELIAIKMKLDDAQATVKEYSRRETQLRLLQRSAEKDRDNWRALYGSKVGERLREVFADIEVDTLRYPLQYTISQKDFEALLANMFPGRDVTTFRQGVEYLGVRLRVGETPAYPEKITEVS